MLGRVAYGQTQYAQTSVISYKGKTFKELLVLGELRTFLTSKTFITFLEVLDNAQIFALKVFKETISLFDNVKRALNQKWIETLSLVENVKKSVSQILKETLGVKDQFVAMLCKLINFVEHINLFFVGKFSLKKIFLEGLALVEDFLMRAKGLVFKEYLEVREAISFRTFKIFQEILGLLDIIRKYLNGFYVKWIKRPTKETLWTKKDIPETEWERKRIRSVED